MKNKELISMIIKSVFGVCGITLLILIVFRESIFPPDSYLVNLYDDTVILSDGDKIVKSLIIIFMVISIYMFVKMVLKKIPLHSNRAIMVMNLFLNLGKYIMGIVVVLMVLAAFGVDTGTLIAGAGVLSLVIGLGCQTLISDIVSGLFIVFEGDFTVGDVVVIDGWRGTVQAIGIRTTKIIDAAGNVKIINNSNISDIVNNTKELSIAVCLCGVDYNDSLERIEGIIEKNLPYMKQRVPAIVEGPFYKGVEELGDSSVVIKLVAKCLEDDKFQVQRDMNRELKIIFDKNNVNIPFPQIVLNKPVTVETPTRKKNMDKFVDDQKELSKGIEEEN